MTFVSFRSGRISRRSPPIRRSSNVVRRSESNTTRQRRLGRLGFEATAIAASTLADALGFEEESIERAHAYAERDLAAGEDDSRFITLLFDFVREDDHRGIVFQRLTDHVDRRRTREEDVDGLF